MTKRVYEHQNTLNRFRVETKKHRMTVGLDKGLYRHIRFMDPKSSGYWFELITSPGQLTFRGDGPSYVFSRQEDMFGLFRHERLDWIDVDYLAGKCTSANRRRDSLEEFDEDLFRKVLQEQVEYSIEGEKIPKEEADAFRAAIEEDIFGDYNCSDEKEAYRALEDFEFRWANLNGEKDRWGELKQKSFRFDEAYEWFGASKGYNWWFVWACHAIVWGVREYDRMKGLGPAVNIASLGEVVAV